MEHNERRIRTYTKGTFGNFPCCEHFAHLLNEAIQVNAATRIAKQVQFFMNTISNLMNGSKATKKTKAELFKILKEVVEKKLENMKLHHEQENPKLITCAGTVMITYLKQKLLR